MNATKVRRLRRDFESLRGRGGIKPKEMESLATKLGRKRHSRGSEPNWVSEVYKDLPPVSIPHHSELNRFTARSILDQLEQDLERLESEYLAT